MVLFLLVKFGHLSQDNYGGSSSGTMSSWEEKATETPSTARSRPIWQDVQAMGFPVVSIGLAWIMLPVGTANYHWTLTPGIAYMLLMLGAYICLARIATTATKNSSSSDLLSLVDETLRAVSPTACVASAVKLLLFPVEMHFSGTLLVLGILKAFEIASLVSLVCPRRRSSFVSDPVIGFLRRYSGCLYHANSRNVDSHEFAGHSGSSDTVALSSHCGWAFPSLVIAPEAVHEHSLALHNHIAAICRAVRWSRPSFIQS